MAAAANDASAISPPPRLTKHFETLTEFYFLGIDFILKTRHSLPSSQPLCPSRSMCLSQELIYEATLNDQLFDRLPVIIANYLGARSCTLHWRDHDNGHEVFAHSHYFSDAHMKLYTADFADHDLWTVAAISQPNKSWKCSDLVSPKTFKNSHIYNNWIRAIGDDTLHCLGAVTTTAAGFGIIGAHRGRVQADFSFEDVARLEEYLPHIRQMLAIRLRLQKGSSRTQQLDQMINSLDDGLIVVDHSGRVIELNLVAEDMLKHGDVIRIKLGRVASSAMCAPSLESLIANATAKTHPSGGECLLLDATGAVARLTVTPLVSSANPGRALLLFRQSKPLYGRIIANALHRLYGLSLAESAIAVRIADGVALQVIARERSVTVGTLRSQVASILSKMAVNRQSQVAGIIAKIRN